MPPEQPHTPTTNPMPPTNPVPQPPAAVPTTFSALPPTPPPTASAPTPIGPGQQPAHHDRLPGAFSLFSPSWEAFRLNFGAFFLGAIFPFILLILPLVLLTAQQGIRQRTNTLYLNNSQSVAAFNVGVIIVGIIAIILLAVIFVPYMYLLKLQSAKGVKVKFWDNFKHSFHYLGRVFALSFLRSVFILAGFILLIVPGLFMWRRYMLAPYYLIDQDTGINDALKKSAADSKPFSYALWGMIGVYILMSLLGIIPLIGALASAVLSVIYCCAQAVRYTQIKDAKS